MYPFSSSSTAIRCSDPDQIENGDVERKCQTFGCRISYKCRAGYELDGRQHRYCQADGSWSPRLLPECVRKGLLFLLSRLNRENSAINNGVIHHTKLLKLEGKLTF